MSKWCGAGGWRLGTFSFPGELNWLLNSMSAVASQTYTATSAPIQYAAVRAYQGGADIEDYLGHSRRILRAMANKISGNLTKADLLHPKAEGAFYFFIDFSRHKERLAARGIQSSTDLCTQLLHEIGFAALPGDSRFEWHTSILTARKLSKRLKRFQSINP